MINPIIVILIIFFLTMLAVAYFIVKLLKNEERAVEREKVANYELKAVRKENDALKKKLYLCEYNNEAMEKELSDLNIISGILSEHIEIYKQNILELEDIIKKREYEARLMMKGDCSTNESDQSDNI